MADDGTSAASASASGPVVDARPRVLVVVGCTGAGKTKLGIALAKAFEADLISADSIQAYAQLPIASNQCTKEEAEGVRQHAMSVAPPWKAMMVHGFRRAAKALVSDLTARGRNVVIVAGTFYWLESILYRTFLNRDEDGDEEVDATAEKTVEDDGESIPVECMLAQTVDEWKRMLQTLLSNADGAKRARFARGVLAVYQRDATPTSAVAPVVTSDSSVIAPLFTPAHLYALLELLDPATAAKLHPNNSRKVLRAIEVFGEHARAHSDLLAESGGQRGNTGLAYRAQAVWLDCDAAVLDQRLDNRVDVMIQRGLIDEVEKLYRLLWTRQQLNADADMEPWRYESELDPDCDICSRVESRDILPPLTVPTPPCSATAVTAASPLTTDASSSYLGPTSLQFDWERGVGQALGFKEFRPYFTLKFHTLPTAVAPTASTNAETTFSEAPPAAKRQKVSLTESVASPATSSSSADACASASSSTHAAALASCVASCIASLKTRTRTYARVQARWIKSRLWSSPNTATDDSESSHLSMLRLDATRTDAPTWAASVEEPAKTVCAAFLAGERVDLTKYAHLSDRLPSIPPPTQLSFLAAASASSSDAAPAAAAAEVWQKYTCAVCACTCNGALEWSRHLTSRKHRTRATSDSRKAAQMAQQAEVQRARQAKKEQQQAAANRLSEAQPPADAAPLG